MRDKLEPYTDEVDDELLAKTVQAIPVERRLRGLSLEERLRGLPPEEFLRLFTMEEVAALLSREQIAEVLEIRERLAGKQDSGARPPAKG